MPEQLCDVGGGITLCYETFGDPSDPTALLIMGLGMQMVAWQEDFCQELAGRGLHVVRFDNRDIGHSTHLQGPAPSLPQLLRYPGAPPATRSPTWPTTPRACWSKLELGPGARDRRLDGRDDRADARGAPPARGALAGVDHVQHGQPLSGQPALSQLPALPAPRSAASARRSSRTPSACSRTSAPAASPSDPADIRAIAARSFDREHDRTGAGRQLAAIAASGDRTAELRDITAPTLVIHGNADPLIRPRAGGRRRARLQARS